MSYEYIAFQVFFIKFQNGYIIGQRVRSFVTKCYTRLLELDINYYCIHNNDFTDTLCNGTINFIYFFFFYRFF